MAKKKTAARVPEVAAGNKTATTKSKSQASAGAARGASRKGAKTAEATVVSPPGVTIRMYCQGLGDCFLLTFRDSKQAKPTRVLIDCGVFLNTPGEPERMRAVAQDILQETGGTIDLLIVTHEHWDHISGFSHANDIFEGSFTFEQVWMSWAENPDDADARSVKAELGKKKAKLVAALGAVRGHLGLADEDALPDDLVSSQSVLDFLGPNFEAAEGLGVAAAGAVAKRMDLGTTMDWLREKVDAKNFFSPGDRRSVPKTEGVNAYVLGPPRSASQLRKMDPTGDQGYQLMVAQVSLLGAVDALDAEGTKARQTSLGPFDARYRLSEEEAANDPFFRQRYGFANDPLFDPGSAWRRIDQDWLVGGLSRLALQLDVAVNNTSFAVAFELADGRTLIFPGDAQIGNWLSWGSLTFKYKDAAGRDVEVTSKDLLNRAVFYKVGHHGSHNATMRAGGLEEMTSGELVAMIPTDQAYASTKRPPKTGWQMPAHGVYEALHGFTKGRIIRADHGSPEGLDEEADPSLLGSRAWTDFRGRVRFGGKFPADAEKDPDFPLYVEYTIPAET
ncbi:MBL fold metallo-hydrolase [Singulisphaera rosea]